MPNRVASPTASTAAMAAVSSRTGSRIDTIGPDSTGRPVRHGATTADAEWLDMALRAVDAGRPSRLLSNSGAKPDSRP